MEIYFFLEVKISFLHSCQSIDGYSAFFLQPKKWELPTGWGPRAIPTVSLWMDPPENLVRWRLLLLRTTSWEGFNFSQKQFAQPEIGYYSKSQAPITNKYVQIRASPKSHKKKVQRKNENIFWGWWVLGVLFVLHHIFEQIYSLKNVVKKIFCCCFTS